MMEFVACLLLLVLHLWCVDPTQSATIGALSDVEEIRVLAGQQPPASATFSCAISVGINPTSIQWLHNGNIIVVDGQKYRLVSNTRLQISDLVGEDEGLYSCSFLKSGSRYTTDLAKVYVLGAAGFTSSETSTMDITSGANAVLDTNVIYTGAGPCQNHQTITLLQLYKIDNETGNRKITYFCSNEGSRKANPCPSTDRFLAHEGSSKFDLSLTLKNVSVLDAGEYLARVEVLHPGVSSRSYIRKSFVIRVHEPLEVTIEQGDSSKLGSPYSLLCRLPLANIQPSQVQLEWTNSRGENLTNDNTITLTTVVTPEEISLTVKFDSLTNEQVGDYYCTALLNLRESSHISETVATTIEVHSNSSEGNNGSYFQVSLGPVSSNECSIWFDYERSSIMERTIREGIAASLSEECGCEISPDAFNVGGMSCTSSSDNWLTYSTSVKKTATPTAEEQLVLFERWMAGSIRPTIRLGFFTLDVNATCSGRIVSLTTQIC